MKYFYWVSAFLFLPNYVLAAGGLSLEPVYAAYSIGETFEVRVIANSGKEPISAAEAEISFDAGALVVENISTEGSILGTFSTGPTFSNEEGTIRLAGWTAQPYTGAEGLLATITFKALRNIVADVRFASGALLASDSRGSNVLERMASALYSIAPRTIAVVPPEEGVGAGEVAGAVAEKPAPPVIGADDLYLEAGEPLVVRGTSIPSGLVTIYTSKDGMTMEASVVSAQDGSFTYISGVEAEEGVYRISADVETLAGARSERSEQIMTMVRAPRLSAMATVALPFATNTLSLATLIALGVACVAFLLYRRTRVHTD